MARSPRQAAGAGKVPDDKWAIRRPIQTRPALSVTPVQPGSIVVRHLMLTCESPIGPYIVGGDGTNLSPCDAYL